MSESPLPAESNYPGNLYVVAAPSGTGKSSLVKALMELDSRVSPSVSHTTRAPRGQEKEGREYHFVDQAHFDALVAENAFLEWAKVHNNAYGTSRQAIDDQIAKGTDVVLEIDYQGALQIKRIYKNAVLIFILPPSWEELRSRLERRAEDSGGVQSSLLYMQTANDANPTCLECRERTHLSPNTPSPTRARRRVTRSLTARHITRILTTHFSLR